MKLYTVLLATSLFATASLQAQTLAEANKCYEDKEYQCAINGYKLSLQNKTYAEKDLATINYRIGFGLGKLEKYREAIGYLKSAIQANPTWGYPVWELAFVYKQSDSLYRAAEYYGKAANLFKNDPKNLKSIYYWKGRCEFDNRLYTTASTSLKQSYDLDSTDDNTVTLLADASYYAGRYTDARKYYEKCIQHGLKNNFKSEVMGSRYYALGQTLHKLGEYTSSEQQHLKALAAGYGAGKVYWALGGSNLNQKQYRESQDYYTKAIAEYRGDSSSLATLHYFRGKALLELNESSRAQADFAQSLRYNPNYSPAVRINADQLKKTRKYREAIVAYNNAIKQFWQNTGDLADLHYARGLCYLEMKDSLRAKSDFLFAIEYDANFAEPNMELGHMEWAKKMYSTAGFYYNRVNQNMEADSAYFSLCYFRKGFCNIMQIGPNYTQAENDLRKSLSYNPRNAEASRYLADAYYAQKKWNQAETELTRSIELYGKQKDSLAKMYEYRGSARGQQSKYKEALADYEQADKMKAIKAAETIKYMGQIAFELKEYDKAIGFFNRLATIYPSTQKSELYFVYYARGRSYYELKKKTNAVQDLEKALEYIPNNEDAKNWLTKARALP
jgi:tetratricopeptide (TPR) repeat protein